MKISNTQKSGKNITVSLNVYILKFQKLESHIWPIH